MNRVGAIEQARITLMSELNSLQEVRNTEIIRQNLAEFPQIYIPAAILDMATARVLTTELGHGRKVSKLTPLSRIDHHTAELAAGHTRRAPNQAFVHCILHRAP